MLKKICFIIAVAAELCAASTGGETMKITSSAFQEGQPMPNKFAYRNENLNPELIVEGVPKEAKSLVLINDDPDAPMGTWNHWLVWNISPSTKKIEEGKTPMGATVGKNDFNETKYDGPAPPSGTHRYFFKLYALNKSLDLKAGATRKELDDAMQESVIAEASLMGTYSSKK